MTPREKLDEKNECLRKLRGQLEAKDRELGDLRREIEELRAHRGQDASDAGTGTGGIRPENVVWMFGTGRSGSTWMSSMIDDLEGHTVWREPLVGALFGKFYAQSSDQQRDNKNFILGQHRETWLGSIRSFVLEGIDARFPEMGEEGYLTVKEPNGSVGAPLLAEALPESRLILLIRDPRDVTASSLDARKEGSWLHPSQRRPRGSKPVGEDQDAFVKRRAKNYLSHIGNSKEAYESHEGPKTLVRYEDLLADTLGTMKRLYSDLGIAVDEEKLARVVNQHSWENIPEEKKGEGKFYRKAKPGSWREDLTPEQVEIVEEITAPILEAFYPE